MTGLGTGQAIALVTLVVDDYDRAIEFYVGKLGFDLICDVQEPNKRWVVVAPAGGAGQTQLLLAKAKNQAEQSRVGNQTGGRVGFFLNTDNFERDYATLRSRGVRFREAPRHESYGTVAVFEDLYGNAWDLLQPR